VEKVILPLPLSIMVIPNAAELTITRKSSNRPKWLAKLKWKRL